MFEIEIILLYMDSINSFFLLLLRIGSLTAGKATLKLDVGAPNILNILEANDLGQSFYDYTSEPTNRLFLICIGSCAGKLS